MSFDWREYLELAQKLTKQVDPSHPGEAEKRSAVSRAYYAAFCWVRNYAETNWGFRRTGTAEDHKYIREYLKRQNKASLASNLGKLRGWRNSCDYNDEVQGLDQLVKNAIKIASKIIQKCSG